MSSAHSPFAPDHKDQPNRWNAVPRPLYHGDPWFLGASIAWYRFRDRFNI